MTSRLTFDDALDVVRTAAHLGSDIPAIPGTAVHVLYQIVEDSTIIEGVFPSRDHALRRAAQLSLEPYVDEPTLGPWHSINDDINWDDTATAHAAIREWCAERTDEQIIADCNLLEEWDILPFHIESDGTLPPLL